MRMKHLFFIVLLICVSCQDEMLEQSDINVTRAASTTTQELDELTKVTIDIWSAYENRGTDEITLNFTSHGVITQEDMDVIISVRGDVLMAIASDWEVRYIVVPFEGRPKEYTLKAGQSDWEIEVCTETNSSGTVIPGRPTDPSFGDSGVVCHFTGLKEVNYGVGLKNQYRNDQYYYVMGEHNGIIRCR